MPVTAPPPKKDNTPWMTAAIKDLGVKEAPGSANNPKVVGFWQMAKLSWIKDDATPWCAGFVNAKLEETGIKGTRAPNARSFVDWETHVNGWYYGCVIVFNRPPSKSNGHVAFLVAHSKTHVLVLGGNQDDKVSYAILPKWRIIAKQYPSLYIGNKIVLEEQAVLSGKPSEREV